MGGGRDDQRLSNVRQEAAEMRIRVSSTCFVSVLYSGANTECLSRIRFFHPGSHQKI
jgi:hypothetical protein